MDVKALLALLKKIGGYLGVAMIFCGVFAFGSVVGFMGWKWVVLAGKVFFIMVETWLSLLICYELIACFGLKEVYLTKPKTCSQNGGSG